MIYPIPEGSDAPKSANRSAANAEHKLNQAAFRRMEECIKQTYPHGQFVGIVGGEIVADAADFFALHALLKAAAHDPSQAFIIQAGHDYPEYAIIF